MIRVKVVTGETALEWGVRECHITTVRTILAYQLVPLDTLLPGECHTFVQLRLLFFMPASFYLIHSA